MTNGCVYRGCKKTLIWSKTTSADCNQLINPSYINGGSYKSNNVDCVESGTYVCKYTI